MRNASQEATVQIAVMGASQGVGLVLVRLELAAGHEVTALVRGSGRPALDDPRLVLPVPVYRLKDGRLAFREDVAARNGLRPNWLHSTFSESILA